MKISSNEKELIECIRNYRNSFPNGERNQRAYIEMLIADLMDADDSPRDC